MTEDLFTMNPDQFNSRMSIGVIIILLVSVAINIYDGFRKARIQ